MADVRPFAIPPLSGAALAERLANTLTPAGPTLSELGGNSAFVSLTAVRESLRIPMSQPELKDAS